MLVKTEIDAIDRAEWSRFVASHPRGAVFHTPEMAAVYRRAKLHKPLICAALDDKGRIVGLILAVILQEHAGMIGSFSPRSILWGGPLVAEGARPEVLNALLGEYNRLAGTRAVYSQVRNLQDTADFSDTFVKAGYAYEPHLNYLVDLTKDEDQLFEDLYPKRRNEVRRAYKVGTSVSTIADISGVGEAYEILRRVYASIRLPLADYSLFKAAFDILQPKGMIKFFGAYYDGRLIGSVVVLIYQGVVYNWYAGSKREFYSKYPNDLLIWEVIKWGANNGMKRFDLGGAGKPDDDYGVRDFKRKFGGDEVEFGRWIKVHKPLTYELAKLGFRVWQRFPGKGLDSAVLERSDSQTEC